MLGFRSITWLSRLFPPNHRIHRIAPDSHNHRARHRRRRRRMANLESLEGRALLAGIVTFNPFPLNGELDIVAPAGGVQFKVMENADGTVTVSSLNGPRTGINGPLASQTTLLP